MANFTTTDSSEKRISLVYNSDVTGFQPIDFSKLDNVEDLVRNAYPQYNAVELYYDGGNNNTGVYYKQNGNLVRKLELMYDGSNNVTGVFTTNY